MSDETWRSDPIILQVDADAQEQFNSEWAPRFHKHVAGARSMGMLRDLWLVAYSAGFMKAVELGMQLGSTDDFPPTPPDGDRGKEEGDEDRLEGGGDNGDGPD